MRILLTNNTLAWRAGSELYLRDVAIELMRRGHHPVAYSTKLGEVAEELRAATVPVISRLESLGEEPDIIHGQHHYETLTAMLWFPRTPAIYYCHGWLPWEETPLRFPRILHYAAVDEPCRERLITEGGIPGDRIEVIHNFFDPDLFPPRSPLPLRPRRALAFGNDFREDNGLGLLRERCREAGIELDATGLGGGNPDPQPGRLLADYDIVFAKARSAIEALAVGTAVVLCNAGRLGPMVTTENFTSLRSLNFGIRALSSPLLAGLLDAQLRRYDAGDAMSVARLAREQCRIGPAVDRITALYERVIGEARNNPVGLSLEAGRAASSYLERYAERFKSPWQLAHDGFEMRDARIARLEQENEYWRNRCSAGESSPAVSDQQRQEIERWRQQCEQAERDLLAMRMSATWRWTQAILRNTLVQWVLGPWIRSVAQQSTPSRK